VAQEKPEVEKKGDEVAEEKPEGELAVKGGPGKAVLGGQH
jgi:hypothetical protein